MRAGAESNGRTDGISRTAQERERNAVSSATSGEATTRSSQHDVLLLAVTAGIDAMTDVR